MILGLVHVGCNDRDATPVDNDRHIGQRVEFRLPGPSARPNVHYGPIGGECADGFSAERRQVDLRYSVV